MSVDNEKSSRCAHARHEYRLGRQLKESQARVAELEAALEQIVAVWTATDLPKRQDVRYQRCIRIASSALRGEALATR